MQSSHEKFLIRKYQYMITSLGTSIAIGCLSKKDFNEIKKGIAFFKEIGYHSGIEEYKQLLEQVLKNRQKRHLTVVK